MRVGHQIGDRLTIREQLLKNSPVSFRRPNDSCTGPDPTSFVHEQVIAQERVGARKPLD